MIEKNETTLVNFKVDTIVKECAESTLSAIGLNMSSYIGMCLRQVAQGKTIPFVPSNDPEFWAVEAEISKVMATVESGAYKAACDIVRESPFLENGELVSNLEPNNADSTMLLYMWKREGRKSALIGELIDGLDIVFAAFDKLGVSDPAITARWHSLFEGMLEDYYHSIDEETKTLIEGAVDGDSRSADTVRGFFSKVDALISSVDDAYTNHREHLAMRFSGGTASQEWSLICAANKRIAQAKKYRGDKDAEEEFDKMSRAYILEKSQGNGADSLGDSLD